MYSFGLMDNLIMIQAGDAIDSTIGATLAFSTLTSAAFGQLCSDSCGVLFGNSMERLAGKLGLPKARLTDEQADTAWARNVGTAGAVIGVMLGCLTGMLSLHFMDLDKREREERQAKLDGVFRAVMEHSNTIVECERSALFVVDEERQQMWSRYATKGENSTFEIIQFPIGKGVAGHVATTGEMLAITDAYNDPLFNRLLDAQTGFKTKTILCGPVVDSETGKVIGVVQFVNKKGGDKVIFTDCDKKLMRMLCVTIAEQMAANN